MVWGRSWSCQKQLDETPQPKRSRQLFELRLRILQIRCIEPLGEPTVYRNEQITSFSGFSIGVPEVGEAGGGDIETPEFGRVNRAAARYSGRPALRKFSEMAASIEASL